MSLKLTTADGESCFQDFLVSENDTRACLKNHSRNLHAPLCGIFHPNSVAVAHYGALIRAKYPTKSIHKNIRFFHLFMIYLLLSPSFSVTQTYLWHSLQAHNIIRFAIYQLNSAFRRLAADLQNIFT